MDYISIFQYLSRMQGFVLKGHGHNFGLMFTMLQQGIGNSQPEFECQPSSYKQDTELIILCSGNKVPVFFFFRFKY